MDDTIQLHRKIIRLKDYDYSLKGAYFVTLCTQDRNCLFGEIIDNRLQGNEFSKIVSDSWQWLSKQYLYVYLDEWVLMPNHFHGILVICDDVEKGGSRTSPTKIKPLGGLIGAFKTVSTKQINLLRKTPSGIVWQRSFYDRIIRNDKELDLIRHYICENSFQWDNDKENPWSTGKISIEPWEVE